MRRFSGFILVLLLAACSATPSTRTTATQTTVSGLQSTDTPQPAQPTPIMTEFPLTDTPATAEATSTALPRLAGGALVTLVSIHMIDTNIGWGIEKDGHILRTRDGGDTWQDVTPPQGLYNDGGFFALDANRAWATHKPSAACEDSRIAWSDYQACMPGPEIVLWRTIDGGRTWQTSGPYEAEDGHYKPIAIQFIDAHTGWFLYVSSFGPMGSTTMGMAKTGDGGLTWMHAVAPQTMCIHRTMLFTSAQDGWSGADCRFVPIDWLFLQDFLSGKFPFRFYRTSDGAASNWDDEALPSPDAFPAGFTAPDADSRHEIFCGVTGMERISSEAFSARWTCSMNHDASPQTDFSYQYLTSDRGQTWRSWLATGNEFFLNAQTGWRLYSPGGVQLSQLQQTSDGGRAWTTIKTVAWQSAQFDFVSEQVGWAIVTSGDAVTFVHTTDGGRNWSELKSRTVTVISPENASQLAKLPIGPTDLVNFLAFSPDWATMVSLASDYSGLRLWHMNSRLPYLFIPFKSGDCGLRDMDSITFSPDGTLLAAGLCSATVKIWRVADGTVLQKLEGELPDGAPFSPDGSMLITINYSGIELWRVSDRTILQGFPVDVLDSVAFSPDGTTLALGSRNGLQLWRVADGTLLRTLSTENFSYSNVAFSPDGRLLASAAEQPGLRLWQVADGTLLKTLDTSPYTFIHHKLIFSPDGRLLASARYRDDAATVLLWQIPDGKLLRTLTGANTPLNFSPDGSRVALGSANVIQVWAIPAGKAK